MFTVEEREALRDELLKLAQADARITGVAITGSGSLGNLDRWSDIDLAFGVADPTLVKQVLADFSDRMYRDHGVLHHLDVPSGNWIYRVFLLPNTLQVDLAFAPAADFGARAPTFRLVSGTSVELPKPQPPKAESLIAWAWLYALHARSSIARGKVWQAEYMISGMRDQLVSLACLRHNLPTHEGRGVDRLPPEVLRPIEEALVQNLTPAELSRAFRAATECLLGEIHRVDPELEARLQPALLAMTVP